MNALARAADIFDAQRVLARREREPLIQCGSFGRISDLRVAIPQFEMVDAGAGFFGAGFNG